MPPTEMRKAASPKTRMTNDNGRDNLEERLYHLARLNHFNQGVCKDGDDQEHGDEEDDYGDDDYGNGDGDND